MLSLLKNELVEVSPVKINIIKNVGIISPFQGLGFYYNYFTIIMSALRACLAHQNINYPVDPFPLNLSFLLNFTEDRHLINLKYLYERGRFSNAQAWGKHHGGYYFKMA